MDAEFWIKAWRDGRTAFHQAQYHEKLTKYFPRLEPEAGQKVLVPLCGKTKDMVWLHRLGLEVHGVELHEQAVRDFFPENALGAPDMSRDAEFVRFARPGISVRCGDFFKLAEADVYDFVYDRGSLVALPAGMRKDYVRTVEKALKPGGGYLLIAYEYDTSRMEGPPFSVGEDEVRALYQDRFTVELIESGKPAGEGARLSAVEGLRQNVYLLRKNSLSRR